MESKRLFRTQDIPLIGIFSALWIVLNLFVAPLSFALTGLPVIHDFLVFFVLLLVAWLTGRLGAASFVGLIGSAIALLAGGPPPIIGFAACSIVFDATLILNHHRLTANRLSVAITATATFVAAYVAANINGLLVLGLPPAFSTTIWSALNLAGAALSLIVTFPIIATLERAKIRQIKS